MQAKAAAAAPVAAAPVAAVTAKPLRVPLSRESLDLFARLASIEARPLEDLLAELLTNKAAHLARTRPALQLGEADRLALARYVESVERDDEEQTARRGTTPAMLETAAAADLREAFPAYHHDDEETRHSLPILCGHADIALAIEG